MFVLLLKQSIHRADKLLYLTLINPEHKGKDRLKICYKSYHMCYKSCHFLREENLLGPDSKKFYCSFVSSKKVSRGFALLLATDGTLYCKVNLTRI